MIYNILLTNKMDIKDTNRSQSYKSRMSKAWVPKRKAINAFGPRIEKMLKHTTFWQKSDITEIFSSIEQ